MVYIQPYPNLFSRFGWIIEHFIQPPSAWKKINIPPNSFKTTLPLINCS